MHEVIVVGGGPAGAATALLLARQGRRVLIVDRDEFPRPKPCGDCLSAAATGLLRRMGLLDRVLDAGAAAIDDWRIHSPGGHACQGGLPGDGALALERRALDHVLLRGALDAGAELVHGRATDIIRPRPGITGVAVREGSGAERRLRAALVVGADGLRSVVARRAGLIRRRPRLRKLSLTTHGTGRPARARHGEMHVLDGGCFGLAPAGGDRFNLTLVVTERHARELRDVGPQEFFGRWLHRAPALRSRLEGAELDNELLGSGPFDWPTRSTVAPGLALVGDAAGYYDPFTGQGIYQALEGARRLSGALAAVDLEDPRGATAALRRYAGRLQRLKRPARRVQRLVELAFARPARADGVVRRLGRAPEVMDALVEVTGDLRPAATLLSPRLVSTFVFPRSPELP